MKKNKLLMMDKITQNQIEDGKSQESLAVLNDSVFNNSQTLNMGHKEATKYHDSFTGMFNKLYFEETLPSLNFEENLPISIIICDVNKLKLVNDSLGCKVGDKLLKSFSTIFQRASHQGGFSARVDSDEFICVLLNTDEVKAKQKIERMNSMIMNHSSNVLEISVSFGHSTKSTLNQKMDDLIQKAYISLSNEKSKEKNDLVKRSIILVLKTMFSKYKNEKEHSKRVGSICERMGKYFNFSLKDIHKLKVAGAMHDIGKIAVDEKVLFKKGKLTRREWIEVKSHVESGFRILASSTAFLPIADSVYQHHEKWDGTGYPNGLKGEEILLNARIIAIAEAWDALTAYKSYRSPMSKEEALEEIQRCSGSQFDPAIVKAFINVIKE